MKNLFLLVIAAATIGFAACTSAPAGDKAKTEDAKKVEETVAALSYTVDTTNSMMTWEGSGPAKKHNGTLRLQDGKLEVKDGKLVGGTFNINMNSIANSDLKPADGKGKLEAHLKGTDAKQTDDFFNVAKYPTASFTITGVEAVAGEADMYNITGNLTLKAVTKSVTFKSKVQMTEEKVIAEAPQFTIDRTIWGIAYGTKTLDAKLKESFINDMIGIGIKLEAKKG